MLESKGPIEKCIALLFALAIFISAALMFVIEPMVAKMLLPAFGGSPSVWNTCVVFFQVMLLAGYLYAHILCKHVRPRVQAVMHLFVIWLPVMLLPIRSPNWASGSDHPFVSLLALLLSIIGFLFFAISTSAPLMQSWYSKIGSIGSGDPYFLYAASNAGGLLGLLVYPIYLEPNFSIVQQSNLISTFYLVYAVLVSVSVFILFMKSHQPGKTIAARRVEADGADAESASMEADETSMLLILLLTMVPASLVLGLTNYVTNELSSIPFFWIAPLFLYLVSFVLAFSRPHKIVLKVVNTLAPLMILLVVITIAASHSNQAILGSDLVTSGLSLHLIAFFFVCSACHMKVAALRPAPCYLTRYYLLISFGGIAGSSFNTFLAPLLFNTWAEYPLMFLIAGIILTPLPQWVLKLSLPGRAILDSLRAGKPPGIERIILVLFVLSSFACSCMLHPAWQILIPVSICFMVARDLNALRIGLAAQSILIIYGFCAPDATAVYQRRNFFGSLTICADPVTNSCLLYHGSTMHGAERIDPDLRGTPISYYNPRGPIGSLLRTLFGDAVTLEQYEAGQFKVDGSKVERAASSLAAKAPIAVIGLGCGTVAAYAKTGQRLDYYEIDPQIIAIAENPLYFTYLFQSKQRKVDLRIVKGDGRIGIQHAPYNCYEIILVDAFSSDWIPTHLITREAAKIYLSKLKADGILAFNISNHYFDLRPVLSGLAEELKVRAFIRYGLDGPDDVEESASTWVLFSRDAKIDDQLQRDGWKPLRVDRPVRLWTDDYCSPLNILEMPFS